MSLTVHQLSKQFGQKLVVDQLSFSIEKGQILGLLGPNGAGKSTTMRMLTGYIVPTTGWIQVLGYDLQGDALAAKKRIGYLPEHNPLYLDMYVQEYLQFMGRLHGLGARQCRSSVVTVVEQCSLGEVRNKKIEVLSKGYRQRVGLAQALIHNPPVLILDEPTAGLDPNQLQHIRGLLKALSREKAILLSTHIIQEVETMCDRVMILHQGKVCLEGSLAAIVRQGQRQFTVSFDKSVPVAELQSIPIIEKVEPLGLHICKLYVNQEGDIYETIFNFAQRQGLIVQRLEQKKESLEEIFVRLTQSTTTASSVAHALPTIDH